MQEIREFSGKLERIVFIGFMGAGKSTVGRLLAERLGWRFVDADHRLEEQTGATIADLFTSLGEPGFRRMEAGVAEEIMRDENLVLALGGGAVETDSTRALLQSSSGTFLVFLEAPLTLLIQRCQDQPNAAIRPVLNDPGQLEARWQGRLPYYRQAHLTVSTAGLSPESVADQVLELLRDHLTVDSEKAKPGPKEVSR